MSNTIAQSLNALQAAKSDITGAITGKGVTVPDGSGFSAFAGLIADIAAGTGGTLLPLENPGAAADALEGKEFYDENGQVVTGSIPEGGTADVRLEADGGIITATVTGGKYYPFTNMMQLQDAEMVSGNIRSGVEIFGVTGTYTGQSSLPSGVAKVGYGTFTLASDISQEASFTFSHGMEVRPDFVLIWTEAETTADNKGNILGAVFNTLTPPFHTFDWGSTATSAYKESSITGWSRNSSSGALNNYAATQAYSTRWALDAENVTIGAMSANYYWPAGIEYKWIGVKLA